MHNLLHVNMDENPTSQFLSPYASSLLVRSPLLAIGTVDSDGWPWTTLWGGEAGFSQPVAKSIIGIKTMVDRIHDPVLQILLGDSADGEVVQEKDGGKMVGGLAIDLQSRQRVKLYGKSIAGAVSAQEQDVGEVQLVVKIEQSLGMFSPSHVHCKDANRSQGNCPKYLNKKHIVPRIPQPKLESTQFPLPASAVDLLAKADLFFMSTSNHETDMDTNHRGGPPGFIRILSNDQDGFTLVYPEYSGNRLYQSLGNLKTTPRAGLVIPDFDTGDVLYVTGETEILTGKDAKDLIAHTNLAVKIRVKSYKFVRDGLSFRGLPLQLSPYNPPVRYLFNEDKVKVNQTGQRLTAELIDKKQLTPTISRLRFRTSGIEKDSRWKAGQYVALDFSDELDQGYSHMREGDKQSLNDDWMRTFTISSGDDLDGNEFEITIRKVGPVTEHLTKINVKSGLEVGLQGFGGEFYLKQPLDESVSYISAGIGITPLLAQVSNLDLKRFRLHWTIRGEDLPLVLDSFRKFTGLAERTNLYVTGNVKEGDSKWKELQESGAAVKRMRMTKLDLENDDASKFYICTGTNFRTILLKWLAGKSVEYEGFNY